MNKKRIFFGIAIALGLAIAGSVYQNQYNNGIMPYSERRGDRQTIARMMRDDWWLLISDDHQESFSVDHMIDNRAPFQEDSFYDGRLIIDVLRVHGKMAGFVAYYLKNETTGHVLFLVVDKDHRRKGYSKILLTHAIHELMKQGVTAVDLVTRSQNTRAQSLYVKMGFVERWRDGYVRYRYLIPGRGGSL